MRVLHIVGRSHRRGAELVAVELSDALVPLGHEGRLLAVGLGHEGGRLDSIPVLTDSVRQHPLALLRAARALRRELASRPVDVILAHGGSAMQAAVLASLSRRSPIVYQLIMGMPLDEKGPIWRRWTGWLLGRCDAIVSLTTDLSDEVRALGYSGPIVLIPNARDARRFASIDRSSAARALRDQVDIAEHVALVGFVGHLVDQKRPDVAVDVLHRLRASGVDAHLVVVGDGPNRADLDAQVRALGVDEHVSLVGHRPDVEAVLAGIDVFVLTSDAEGMPGVAIEAQMAGCAVVSFPVGGVSEVVESGVTGIVLDDHDPSSMARALAELLEADRLGEMGAAGRVRSERFSMENAAGRYEQVLAEAVTAREKG